MPRINLHVPYEEKDEAKALGARWDTAARCWYAPDGANIDLLKRWLEPAPAPEAVETLSWTVSVSDPVAVHAPVRCWNCKRDTQVVGLFDNESAELIAFDTIRRIDTALREALRAFPQYRTGYSRSTQTSAFFNHCEHCEALQGDWFLYNEPDGPFFAIESTDYPGREQFTVYGVFQLVAGEREED